MNGRSERPLGVRSFPFPVSIPKEGSFTLQVQFCTCNGVATSRIILVGV